VVRFQQQAPRRPRRRREQNQFRQQDYSVSKIQVFDPGPKGLGRQIALSAPTAADAKKKLPVDKDGGVRSGTDLAALGPANVYTPSFPWYPGMLGKYWGVFDGQLCEVSKAPLRLVSDPRAID
jgi:hypothetical protein